MSARTTVPARSPSFPNTHRGLRNARVLVSGREREETKTAHVIRGTDDPDFAYCLIGKEPRPIFKNRQRWGDIETCVAFPRDMTNSHEVVFQAPDEGDHQLVDVKRLNKQIVESSVMNGVAENPFSEFKVMQLIGDNVHVLGCIEVLVDEENLYLITPYCEGKSLWDLVPLTNDCMREDDARHCLRKMLDCISYLHSRGICHRGLCPESFMICNGRCILSDLGMGLRVPYTDDGRRLLMTPQGRCGPARYMSPEVWGNTDDFDGFAVDLWAIGIILCRALTGVKLYDFPFDSSFRNYIYDGRLANLLTQLGVSEGARDLLTNMLRPDPSSRLTLAQVMEHSWVSAGSWRPSITVEMRRSFADVRDTGRARNPSFDGKIQNAEVFVVDASTQVEKLRTVLQASYHRAYLRDDSEEPILIKRAGEDWGEVFFCHVVIRDGTKRQQGSPVFVKAQTNGVHQRVAVKMLRKAIVRKYICAGGVENPYNEFTATQLIGDNVHVLGCIDVMQDDIFLYMVTPMCNGGDLCDAIPWKPKGEIRGGLPETTAREYFRQILDCLEHLQSRGICHRDLSPENIMIHNSRCVLIDLGMGLRVPYGRDGHHLLMTPQGKAFASRALGAFSSLTPAALALPFTCHTFVTGQCGKTPYMSPEIYDNEEAFDGFAIDLWCAATTLAAMLTGVKLFGRPTPVDSAFRNCILDGGLAKLLMSLGVSKGASDLLQKMLRRYPSDRLTLAQVREHPWVTGLL